MKKKPQLILILITAFALTAIADEDDVIRHHRVYGAVLAVQTDAPTTGDSSTIVSGKLNPDATRVLIQVSGPSGYQASLVTSEVTYDQLFAKRVFLNGGPGDYAIQVFTAPPNGENRYAYFARTQITNTDVTDPRTRVLSSAEEGTGGVALRIASTRVSDSHVRIQGTASPQVRWLWLKLSSGGSAAGEYFARPAASGAIDQHIYLKRGAGDYQIVAWATTNQDRITRYTWRVGELDVRNDDAADESFLLPGTDIESDDPAIRELAANLTRDAKTDLERSRALYAWVTSNVTYDTDQYFSGNPRSRHRSDALETLALKRAVCQGYANLSAALHRAAGLRAKYVRGQASPHSQNTWENHAWNEIWIDGRWVVEDPTWDSGYVTTGTKIFTSRAATRFFDPNPVDFATSHRKDSETD
ncbi:MAG: transglutaminase domain-containing protein [Deltaproteobacteria bacterium]|nr:transglutaminase domain-containing protein [Deltaproteobacteria bacterium]